MKVNIVVDTDNDSVTELRKLETWVQDIIKQRENNSSSKTESYSLTPASKPIESQPRPVAPNNTTKTAGGSSVIPYEDMSELLGKIASGEKLR